MLGLLVMACSSGTKTDPYWLACFKQSGLQKIVDEKRYAEIFAYQYKGQIVFMVGDNCTQCSDRMGKLYSCDGQVICLFGGIGGLNACPDFADVATDRVLVWKWN